MGTEINNCKFSQEVNVDFDGDVVELLQTVANGLVGIVELVKTHGATFTGPMLNIDRDGTTSLGSHVKGSPNDDEQ